MRTSGDMYHSSVNIGDIVGKSNSVNKSNNGGSACKCPMCDGTGKVRYYYGESDLEAYITGHESYTVGKCTSCGGTGKY